jgi:hypothetical protein
MATQRKTPTHSAARMIGLSLLACPSLAWAADKATEPAIDGVEVLLALTLLVILSLLRWTDHRPQIPWRRLSKAASADDFSLNTYRASLGREPQDGEVFVQRLAPPTPSHSPPEVVEEAPAAPLEERVPVLSL